VRVCVCVCADGCRVSAPGHHRLNGFSVGVASLPRAAMIDTDGSKA
jgi:hypothetical protein